MYPVKFLTACAAFAVSASTLADTLIDSSLAFSNVRVSIHDLTPNDDYQATAWFRHEMGSYSLDGRTWGGWARHDDWFSRNSVLQDSIALEGHFANFGKTAGFGNFSLGTGMSSAVAGWPEFWSVAGSSLSLTISANSRITLTGTYTLDATRHGGNYADTKGFASAEVLVYKDSVVQPGKLSDRVEVEYGDDDLSGPLTRDFTISYVNNTTEHAQITFEIGGSAAVFSSVMPVPEPQTYAMLAAGLLLVGGRLRARRKPRR